VKALLDRAKSEARSSAGEEEKNFSPKDSPRNAEGETAEKGEIRLALNEVERVWPEVIEQVKLKEMSTGLFLAESAPVEVTDGVIVLGFPEEFSFHKEMLEAPEKSKLVEETLGQILGRRVRIQLVTTQLPSSPSEGQTEPSKAPTKVPEIVRDALNLFGGGKIVRDE